MTHYVIAYAPHGSNRSLQKAICGLFVNTNMLHHPDPTCPNCRHLLELEAQEDAAMVAQWMRDDAAKRAAGVQK